MEGYQVAQRFDRNPREADLGSRNLVDVVFRTVTKIMLDS